MDNINIIIDIIYKYINNCTYPHTLISQQNYDHAPCHAPYLD